MCGGLMGLVGFDAVRTWERLPTSAKRDLAIPLYAMIETRELYVYDHRDRTLNIIIWSDVSSGATLLEGFNRATDVADQAWRRWQDACTTVAPGALLQGSQICAAETPLPSFTSDQFQHAVTRIQEYIAAGDTYQVNLSLRTSRPARVSPCAIYSALRRINPSPYMGFLQLPDFTLVCGSPELLVKLVDGVVSSRPIAGTRPRGNAAMQDRLYSAELLASEKERAEHLMLVDLIRNDIGRVADFGTVHVSDFMAVEQYSHVMHIVSQVEGRLADGKTWVEVFESMFPGGTITGCPKIRTIEIIEELEPVGRGFYTGAMGWISYSGEMEMNIVIRSMLVQNGVAHVQAGAGIVADSIPARELDEALRKAEALWVALTEATASQENR
jgi:para-aminobenzoate synthetase component 1